MPRVTGLAAVSDGVHTDTPLDINANVWLAAEYIGNVPLRFRPVVLKGVTVPFATFTVINSLPRPWALGCRANTIASPDCVHEIADAGGPGGWLTGRLVSPDVRRL